MLGLDCIFGDLDHMIDEANEHYAVCRQEDDEATRPHDFSEGGFDSDHERGLVYEYRGPKLNDPKVRAKHTPSKSTFAALPSFVPAMHWKGQPKKGESVKGYFFGAGKKVLATTVTHPRRWSIARATMLPASRARTLPR